MSKWRACETVGCVVLLAALGWSSAAQTLPDGEWRFYSGDNGARKYSPLAQIDRSNVNRLRVAWRRPFVDSALRAAPLQAQPLDARVLVVGRAAHLADEENVARHECRAPTTVSLRSTSCAGCRASCDRQQ